MRRSQDGSQSSYSQQAEANGAGDFGLVIPDPRGVPDDNPPEFLYHITAAGNFKSIKKQGFTLKDRLGRPRPGATTRASANSGREVQANHDHISHHFGSAGWALGYLSNIAGGEGILLRLRPRDFDTPFFRSAAEWRLYREEIPLELMEVAIPNGGWKKVCDASDNDLRILGDEDAGDDLDDDDW